MATKSILTLGGDGTAIPSGYIGERISATGGGIVTGAMPAANVAANVATLPLPSAGIYQVFGTAHFTAGATTSFGGDPYAAVSISSTSATANSANTVAITASNATSGAARACSTSDVFTVSSATTLYLVIQHGAVTIGGAAYGGVGANYGTRFYAIRIG